MADALHVNMCSIMRSASHEASTRIRIPYEYRPDTEELAIEDSGEKEHLSAQALICLTISTGGLVIVI